MVRTDQTKPLSGASTVAPWSSALSLPTGQRSGPAEPAQLASRSWTSCYRGPRAGTLIEGVRDY
jgi:hypothetical protein